MSYPSFKLNIQPAPDYYFLLTDIQLSNIQYELQPYYIVVVNNLNAS